MILNKEEIIEKYGSDHAPMFKIKLIVIETKIVVNSLYLYQ